MKKSDIYKIIREEFVNILREQTLITERFGDPTAAMLAQEYGLVSNYSNLFKMLSRSFDIAWDKLPKGSIETVSATDSRLNARPKKVKDPDTGQEKTENLYLAIYTITGDKENPFSRDSRSGFSWDRTLSGPATLGVTLGSKIAQQTGRGDTATIGIGKSRRSEPIGKNVRGTMQVSKLKQLADKIYLLDIGKFQGETTDLKQARYTLQLGADKFRDHKAWKKANIDRYEDILRSRIGSRDKVDRMVEDIVKIANQAVTDAVAGGVTQDKYGDIMTTVAGREVMLKDVTQSMGNALETYRRYIDAENQEDRAAKQGGGYSGQYHGEKKKEYALEIKRYLKGFKIGKIKRY